MKTMHHSVKPTSSVRYQRAVQSLMKLEPVTLQWPESDIQEVQELNRCSMQFEAYVPGVHRTPKTQSL